MENNKSEFSEIIAAVSEFVGAMVGSAVVITKKIEHCLRNMMTVEAVREDSVGEPPGQPRPSDGLGQVAAKPTVADEEVEPASEAPILEAEVEEATAQEDATQPHRKKKMKAKGKKEGEGKEAKIKRKTKKAKKSTLPLD